MGGKGDVSAKYVFNPHAINSLKIEQNHLQSDYIMVRRPLSL
jgi:hypothetical protein